MQGDPGMGLPSRGGAPRTCAGRGADKCEGPEEVTGEEFVDTQTPEEALAELERVLEKDAEEGMPEMSRLSISQRTPGTSVGRERRKKRRLFELAKPKASWQVLKDR
ncbi:sperm microtubule associated protein 2 [Physeter macrocephalus]|uniref:Sperm microtubule associated protein 2 n=1 Tax=Physeter macrocephalus TaxID=9755 RepID=A0A455CBP5_PHYMC|nr:testicular haploid expressed gene protein [Physeter catodon]